MYLWKIKWTRKERKIIEAVGSIGRRREKKTRWKRSSRRERRGRREKRKGGKTGSSLRRRVTNGIILGSVCNDSDKRPSASRPSASSRAAPRAAMLSFSRSSLQSSRPRHRIGKERRAKLRDAHIFARHLSSHSQSLSSTRRLLRVDCHGSRSIFTRATATSERQGPYKCRVLYSCTLYTSANNWNCRPSISPTRCQPGRDRIDRSRRATTVLIANSERRDHDGRGRSSRIVPDDREGQFRWHAFFRILCR